MKLVLLQSSTFFSLGGAPKANRLLLEGLAARGHDCTAIGPALAVHGPRDRQELVADLAARRLSVAPGEVDGSSVFEHRGVRAVVAEGWQALTDTVRRYLATSEPDWVLVSSEDPAQRLFELALEGCPGRVVYIAHTTLSLPFGPDAYVDSRRSTARLRRAAGVLVVSEYLAEYLRRWANLEAQVVRFPVYGDAPIPRSRAGAEGYVTLVNPCKVKGIDIFLQLARAFPDTRFAGVPTWGTTAADRQALEALPNVRILPPVEDIDELYARTRILLVPSVWGEAFGQIAVEAMARGIPVLASDVGGLPEAKLGVEYCLPVVPIARYQDDLDDRRLPVAQVPEQDVAPWAAALGRLLADPEHYVTLAESSRAAALSFIHGVSAEPFETYLSSLTPAAEQPEEEPREEGLAPRDDRLRKLSPEARKLLALRLRRKAAAGATGGAA